MSSPVLVAAMLVLSLVLAVAIVSTAITRRQLRRVVVSCTALVTAKDEQLEAYEQLIAEQKNCIAAQDRLIQAHETRAAVLGLLPGCLDTSGVPRQWPSAASTNGPPATRRVFGARASADEWVRARLSSLRR